MGIRTTRIPGATLPESCADLQGCQVQVLLKNGKNLFGKVVSLTDGSLTLQDPNAAWYNVKKHRHVLAFASIQEIIVDRIAEY